MSHTVWRAEYQALAGCPVLCQAGYLLPVWSPSPALSGIVTPGSGEILSKSAFGLVESWLLPFDLPLLCSSLPFCPVSQNLVSSVRFRASGCPYMTFQPPLPLLTTPSLSLGRGEESPASNAQVPDLPARTVFLQDLGRLPSCTSPAALQPSPHTQACC